MKECLGIIGDGGKCECKGRERRIKVRKGLVLQEMWEKNHIRGE